MIIDALSPSEMSLYRAEEELNFGLLDLVKLKDNVRQIKQKSQQTTKQ